MILIPHLVLQSELTLAQKMLLEHLMQADASGPWAELSRSGQMGLGIRHVRDAFVSCIEYIEVFLPNTLLKALDLQVRMGVSWILSVVGRAGSASSLQLERSWCLWSLKGRGTNTGCLFAN